MWRPREGAGPSPTEGDQQRRHGQRLQGVHKVRGAQPHVSIGCCSVLYSGAAGRELRRAESGHLHTVRCGGSTADVRCVICGLSHRPKRMT